MKKYEYKVVVPAQRPHSEMNDPVAMEEWLNTMGDEGWTLIECGIQHWQNTMLEQFWIFIRPLQGQPEDG